MGDIIGLNKLSLHFIQVIGGNFSRLKCGFSLTGFRSVVVDCTFPFASIVHIYHLLIIKQRLRLCIYIMFPMGNKHREVSCVECVHTGRDSYAILL